MLAMIGILPTVSLLIAVTIIAINMYTCQYCFHFKFYIQYNYCIATVFWVICTIGTSNDCTAEDEDLCGSGM